VVGRARIAWRDQELRSQALLHMRFLLGNRFPSEAVHCAARSYLFEEYKRRELRWRPTLTTKQTIENLETLRLAASAGRGVILSFLHHGQYEGIFPSLGRYGFQLHLPVHPMMVRQEPAPPAHFAQHLAVTTSLGAKAFSSSHSYDHMKFLLKQGHIVGVANDVPGVMRSRFLGRDIKSAPGAALLAVDTGAPIVPITAHRSSWFQTLRIENPVTVAHSSDVASIQEEIFHRHEPAIAAWPGALQEPLRHWKPGDRADFPTFRLTWQELDRLRV
jgi:lauroyl/myristoyl acyltransferase